MKGLKLMFEFKLVLVVNLMVKLLLKYFSNQRGLE